MTPRIVLFMILAVFGISRQASAQTCTALVRDGLFDTVSSASDNVSISAFMNWVRDHRSGTDSTNAGGGISIPIIGSLSGSSDQYSQMESDYASMNSGNAQARSRLTTMARTVSTALAQRFNECLATKGLHVWLETTDDPMVFKVAAVFNSPGAQVSAKVESVGRVPSSVSCDGAIKADTVITGSTRRMLCTRAARNAVTIVVNADSDPIGGGELKLAAIPMGGGIPIPVPTPAAPKCDSQVLVSRGATASHARLTDGVTGSSNPGQNSNRAGGEDLFWVELGKAEWIQRVVVHPFGGGTNARNTIVGVEESGRRVTLASFQTTSTTAAPPVTVYTDPATSKGIRKIIVNTVPDNGRDWNAWVEIEVFGCR